MSPFALASVALCATLLASACASTPPPPAPRPAAATHATAESPPVPVGLAPEQIRAVIHEHDSALRACFLPAAHDEVGERIEARWTILPSGAVSEVATTTGLQHAEIESCVRTEIARMQFPETRGKTNVAFPFVIGSAR